MIDPITDLDLLNRTIASAQKYISGCLNLPVNDSNATCIQCISEAFSPGGGSKLDQLSVKLAPHLDPDIAKRLPVEGSPEYGRDTFARLGRAQAAREVAKLLYNPSRVLDKGAKYSDLAGSYAQITGGIVDGDPCRSTEPPVFPNVRGWPSLTSVQQSYWTPGGASFGDFTTAGDTLASLNGLVATQPVAFRLSAHTSLVQTLSASNLMAEFGNDATGGREDSAQRFFVRYGPALTGINGTWGQLHSSFGSVVRVRQTSLDGIPVYGGVMTASYDEDDLLTFVNNSCYPLPEITFRDRFQRSQADARRIAVDTVSSIIESETHETTELLLQAVEFEIHPGDDFFGPDNERAGQVVMPVLLWNSRVFTTETLDAAYVGKTTSDYLPAWAFWVILQPSGRCWKVVVDAELHENRDPILVVLEDIGGASVQGSVVPTVVHALGLGGFGSEKVVLANTPSGTLTDAPDFKLTGNSQTADRFSNVYYHLMVAKVQFEKMLEHAWPNVADRPTLPDRTNGWKVELTDAPGDAGYNFASKQITIPIGLSGDDNPPIGDPARDPEVIYHEYAHAVMTEVQPDFNQPGNSIFRGAIDEGLAFYFACSLSDRVLQLRAPNVAALNTRPFRWGKMSRNKPFWVDHAHRDLERWQTQQVEPARQRPDHDYLAAYNIFPGFAAGLDDPDKMKYAVGMLWARTLWDIRQILGAEWADAVILRAMHLAGGVQSDLETPAEAIIHVDQQMASEQGAPSHQDALRLIFASRGIFADSPIRVITEVKTGQGHALLAATESPLNDDTACGCLISVDGGVSWQSLGVNGPRDVIALTWLSVSFDQVIVWVAGENWSSNASGPAQCIFCYDLRFDNAGNLVNMKDSWFPLLPLHTDAAIRCLVAIPADPEDPDESAWLFVGTEIGIFKFDGVSWPDADKPNIEVDDLDFAVLDLCVVQKEEQHEIHRLLVAATTSAVEIFEIESHSANNEAALPRHGQPLPISAVSVHSDAPTGGQQVTSIWVGSRNEGLLQANPFQVPLDFVETSGAWPGNGQSKPAVFALARDAHAGQPTYMAGTNRGLFRKLGNGDWQVISLPAPELRNVTILTICQVGNHWLLGTAQRGLWRYDPQANSAIRVTSSVGKLSATGPVLQIDCNGMSGFRLSAGKTNTHLVTVLAPPVSGLRVTVQVQPSDAVEKVELFRASVAIDLPNGHPAGVQRIGALAQAGVGTFEITLQNNSIPGYYVVAVTAAGIEACYTLIANV